jgi:hypothetical protein
MWDTTSAEMKQQCSKHTSDSMHYGLFGRWCHGVNCPSRIIMELREGGKDSLDAPLIIRKTFWERGRSQLHEIYPSILDMWRVSKLSFRELREYVRTSTGLFRKKYTLSKIYFTKTADAKSMHCVRMERKSLKVLISMIWSGASLRLWLLLPLACCDECGKSWIIDLTSAASHVGLTSSACKVWKQLWGFSLHSVYSTSPHVQ